MKITIEINERELEVCKRAYEAFINGIDNKLSFEDYLKVTYEIGGYNRINSDIEVYCDNDNFI